MEKNPDEHTVGRGLVVALIASFVAFYGIFIAVALSGR